MSTTHIRVAATAAMLTTFAAGSTLALNAQTSSQQVQDIIPTPCGNGILTICGEKTISECSVTPIIRGSITVGFNTVPLFDFVYECVDIEQTKLYRDL